MFYKHNQLYWWLCRWTCSPENVPCWDTLFYPIGFPDMKRFRDLLVHEGFLFMMLSPSSANQILPGLLCDLSQAHLDLSFSSSCPGDRETEQGPERACWTDASIPIFTGHGAQPLETGLTCSSLCMPMNPFTPAWQGLRLCHQGPRRPAPRSPVGTGSASRGSTDQPEASWVPSSSHLGQDSVPTPGNPCFAFLSQAPSTPVGVSSHSIKKRS